MSREYTHTIHPMLSYGKDEQELELQVEIEFTCKPGTPDSGPSFSGPGEPGDPAELEIQSATLVFEEKDNTGKLSKLTEFKLPEPFLTWLANNDKVICVLGESCDWGGSYDDDYE